MVGERITGDRLPSREAAVAEFASRGWFMPNAKDVADMELCGVPLEAVPTRGGETQAWAPPWAKAVFDLAQGFTRYGAGPPPLIVPIVARAKADPEFAAALVVAHRTVDGFALARWARDECPIVRRR